MSKTPHYHTCLWNGEIAKFRVVLIIVGPEPDELRLQVEKTLNGRKRYLWFIPFIGERRQAVEVVYEGSIFYLDNSDGSGVRKVTIGMGSPQCMHRSVYPKDVQQQIPQSHWQQYSSTAVELINDEIDEAWTSVDPAGYAEHKKQIEALKKVINAPLQVDENDSFDDFEPCSRCDGHDACQDFGCAIELKLGHLLPPSL